MDRGEIARARELLAAVVAAVESGELVASSAEVAGLRGGLAALDSLEPVRDTTV
jgi:hypothetical protein